MLLQFVTQPEYARNNMDNLWQMTDWTLLLQTIISNINYEDTFCVLLARQLCMCSLLRQYFLNDWLDTVTSVHCTLFHMLHILFGMM